MENNKTFTQEDINRIVSERLAEDRKKTTADIEQREKDLQRKELTLKAKELFHENNLPPELMEVVNFSDDESLNKSIATLTKVISAKAPEAEDTTTKVTISSGGEHGGGSSIGNDVRSAMGLK